MSFPKDLQIDEQAKKGLYDWNILHAYRGSISHNTFVPENDPNSVDDRDTMGLVVPNQEHFYGLNTWKSNGTKEIMQEDSKGIMWDVVLYEIRKGMDLLAKNNPNVMSLLWVNENHYIHISESGKLLLANRSLFSSKLLYKTFVGYAHSQIHRMTRFRDTDGEEGKDKHMSSKRKELVDRFGFDPKNSSHAVRLLRMGIEFLTEGVLYVHRHDAKELLEIKRGEWSLDQVKTETARLLVLAEEAYVRSSLPARVDRDKLSDLCVEIVRMQLAEYND